MFIVSHLLSREPESENDSVETSCHPEPLSKGAAIAKHSAAFREGVQWTGTESEYLVDSGLVAPTPSQPPPEKWGGATPPCHWGLYQSCHG
jgi:hypothetical protein